MGTWTLENITANSTELNGNVFGTNFQVKLKLKYTASTLGGWVESPTLEWHEKFTTLWHHKGTFWKFETNMFEHKPGSPTFQPWAKRYSEAYNFVVGAPSSLSKGSVAFYDVGGGILPKTVFAGKPAGSLAQKADLVRAYLKSNGGVIEVNVQDIPGIGTITADKHVERLLLFDCGLAGDGRRIKAMQYLDVNTNNPAASWQREFKTSSFSRMDQNTYGLKEVPAPADVSTPNVFMSPGEYR